MQLQGGGAKETAFQLWGEPLGLKTQQGKQGDMFKLLFASNNRSFVYIYVLQVWFKVQNFNVQTVSATRTTLNCTYVR
jgi:hypothetical protein